MKDNLTEDMVKEINSSLGDYKRFETNIVRLKDGSYITISPDAADTVLNWIAEYGRFESPFVTLLDLSGDSRTFNVEEVLELFQSNFDLEGCLGKLSRSFLNTTN